MKIKAFMCRLFFILTALLLGMNIQIAAAQTDQCTVLLLPPAIHAQDDLTFLQKGMIQMLTARLTWPDKVAVISADASSAVVNPETAAQLAREAGADYALFGSLTILGGSISTDMRMVKADDGATVTTFSRSGAKRDELIGHMDLLAAQINNNVFGRQSQASQPATAETPSAVPPAASNLRQHPDKLLVDGAMSPAGTTTAAPTDRVNTIQGQGDVTWKSPKLKTEIRGLALGDVDGDGHQEVVLTSRSTVYVYRLQNNRWTKISEIDGRGNYIGVDTVDVNANGIEEIFITNFDNAQNRTISFVLEWDGAAFQRIASNQAWYFRTLTLGQQGKVLVGQKQGLKDLFLPGIYTIQWEGGEYTAAERLPVPRKINVFGLAVGSIADKGVDNVIAYSKGGFLQLYNPGGAKEWESSERYGGTKTGIKFTDKNDPTVNELLHINARIDIMDINGDGLNEILAIKNDDSISRTFKRLRQFKDGRLELLQYTQPGFDTIWQTRDWEKYISDFAVGDVNGDGRREIAMLVVGQPKGIMSDGASYVMIYELPSFKKIRN